jgi:uncharacterized membrane protein
MGRGFLLVLGVSHLVGFVTPTGETLTQEVLARGSPNILDLLIAVFAAMAAAYAMARPNLVGSIAGVAIATALVPSGCAIGISLAEGDVLNGVGAGLLLLTNFAAIIVASNMTFMARPRAEEGVVIHPASEEELPPSYATELRQIFRDEMSDRELPVTVIAVRGLWMSDSDAPEGDRPGRAVAGG